MKEQGCGGESKNEDKRLLLIAALQDVLDLQLSPFFLEIFCNKSTVAIIGFFLATEQTSTIDYPFVKLALDFALGHQVQKLSFVVCPAAFGFPIRV